jgi:hypothetical protein
MSLFPLKGFRTCLACLWLSEGAVLTPAARRRNQNILGHGPGVTGYSSKPFVVPPAVAWTLPASQTTREITSRTGLAQQAWMGMSRIKNGTIRHKPMLIQIIT